MSDPVARLNAALEGRYAIERELGEGDPDPTLRFSNRVRDYKRARPSYPAELIELLRDELGLGPGRIVADVGSGTGILTGLLLDTGSRVIGVEPNDAMRAVAEALLGRRTEFRSVAGTAEDTGLPADSVDVVTAAQAFHWFDVEKASGEFQRILKREGGVALIWNSRHLGGTAFLQAYERFLVEWGRGYTDIRASWDADASIARFFGHEEILHRRFPNEQILNYEGLEARFLSSSYAPPRDDAKGSATLSALRRLFRDHSPDGTVRMTYDAQVYYGRVQGQ